MKIETRQFGTIEVDDTKIITMPAGMPGFPGRMRFVLFEREETRPFYWYQSVDEPNLTFAIMNPYLFKPDYAVNVKPALKEMQWEEAEKDKIMICVIINASKGGPESITANLMGPLLIHIEKQEATQMVIQNSPYPCNYPVFGRV